MDFQLTTDTLLQQSYQMPPMNISEMCNLNIGFQAASLGTDEGIEDVGRFIEAEFSFPEDDCFLGQENQSTSIDNMICPDSPASTYSESSTCSHESTCSRDSAISIDYKRERFEDVVKVDQPQLYITPVDRRSGKSSRKSSRSNTKRRSERKATVAKTQKVGRNPDKLGLIGRYQLVQSMLSNHSKDRNIFGEISLEPLSDNDFISAVDQLNDLLQCGSRVSKGKNERRKKNAEASKVSRLRKKVQIGMQKTMYDLSQQVNQMQKDFIQRIYDAAANQEPLPNREEFEASLPVCTIPKYNVHRTTGRYHE